MKSFCIILMVVMLEATGMCKGKDTPDYIVHNGKPCCIIVLPSDATPGENYAIEELRNHVKLITGAELSMVPEILYSPDMGEFINIGRTSFSRSVISDEEFNKLGDDGYAILRKGKNTFFVGGRKRGSLYAVYHYLESQGVRWYSPDYTVIPQKSELEMPTESIRFKPQFWYRCQWWNNAPALEWLARMRINGNNGQTPRIPDNMGGCIITMHSCHSYEILVPAAMHFDKHPEWFALKEDGNRSRGELCLTNTELRDFVTSRVLSDLKKYGRPIENYWVSQNDGGLSGCFCEKCTGERLAHGGNERWSANTISFVNYVAEGVKLEFPNTRIKALAYSYTVEPPENMTTADNVLIEICGNFGKKGKAHEALVKSWSRVAQNISVYTYGGSNFGYWWPYPNLRELGMQCPWALQNGVTAFYVQGTALGKGSGMVDLRAYLTARLMWDPTRDVQEEIRDFCEGFYGPAAKHIIEYIDWYSNYVKQHNLALYESWGDSEAWRTWVTRDAMTHCDELLQKAIAATANHPVYHKHVRRAYLEALWALVMLDLKPGTGNEPVLVSGADPECVRTRAQLFGDIMRENDYNKLAEHIEYVPGNNLIDAAAKMMVATRMYDNDSTSSK